MNNTNELTILIRAKDEFSDIFKGFGELCQTMQSQAQATAESLTSFSAVLNTNITSLRQNYAEFARLGAMLSGGGGFNADTPASGTGGEQTALNTVGETGESINATGGLFPFNGANTALTLQNIETIKTAMLEFQEFKIQDQEFANEMAANDIQRSVATTDQLVNDMQAVETTQARIQSSRLQMLTGFLSGMSQATKLFGKETFGVTKAIGIAEATVGAYLSFNRTMGAYPYPVNVALAGVSLATSLMQVGKIAATSAGIAHGGLEYVPKEQTYLLDRGERVLSPRQNRDLTAFLENDRHGAVTIENVYIEVFPNVTEAAALKNIDERELRDFVEDRLLGALRELSLAGLNY